MTLDKETKGWLKGIGFTLTVQTLIGFIILIVTQGEFHIQVVNPFK